MTKSRAQITTWIQDGQSGIWLVIVKEIGTAHGGAIHAESIAGLGTKFVVWLSIERAKV